VALTAAGYAPTVIGPLHAQLETEMEYMTLFPGVIDIGMVDSALAVLVARWQAAFPGSLFLLFRLGAPGPGSEQANMPAAELLRSMQEARAQNDSHVKIVFWDGGNFAAAGMFKADNRHYNQNGLNLMGVESATGTVAALGISSP